MNAPTNWQAHMRALAEQAAADLQGTAKSIHDLGVSFEVAQNDATFCRRLDELVFECDGCGWWCAADECNNENGEQFCDECIDDEVD